MHSSSGLRLYEQSTLAKLFKRSIPASPSFSATRIVGLEFRRDTVMKDLGFLGGEEKVKEEGREIFHERKEDDSGVVVVVMLF